VVSLAYKGQENYRADANRFQKKHPVISYESVISCLEAACLFSGFKAHSLQTERDSAIWSAIETLQKANRFCGRARTATVHGQGMFL